MIGIQPALHEVTVGQFRRFVETTGYQRILLVMALPGLDTGHALRSMRLFAEHVAPALNAARL